MLPDEFGVCPRSAVGNNMAKATFDSATQVTIRQWRAVRFRANASDPRRLLGFTATIFVALINLDKVAFASAARGIAMIGDVGGLATPVRVAVPLVPLTAVINTQISTGCAVTKAIVLCA
jgi:hypothetical protein